MILGHAHPAVIQAVESKLALGTSFGAATEGEIELAELICSLVPSIDRVRLVNSGTEATMSAVRVARAATGREHIVKFAGCYHGHADGFLVKAGSGATTLGIPDSPGVPAAISGLTAVADFNDLRSVERVVGDDTAAIIVEPVAANMGVVPPREGFLEGLIEIARARGALVIFDEVITGFRISPGGYQTVAGLEPDLTCLGKIIGGGLPVGAYGGRGDLMNLVAPSGPVYQAGTLSGNPLAVAAGLATLETLVREDPYTRLDERAALLEAALRDALGSRPGCVQRIGSVVTLFFGPSSVSDYDEALQADVARYARFFNGLLDEGVWAPPSQFEAWFVSAAHSDDDISKTAEAVTAAITASD
jgi:glutamate-1-semialdehyde 2,1-aminomutase